MRALKTLHIPRAISTWMRMPHVFPAIWRCRATINARENRKLLLFAVQLLVAAEAAMKQALKLPDWGRRITKERLHGDFSRAWEAQVGRPSCLSDSLSGQSGRGTAYRIARSDCVVGDMHVQNSSLCSAVSPPASF